MNIVVDANILISSCINPAGNLPKIIILNNHKIDFITPEYTLKEMELKKENCLAVQADTVILEIVWSG